MSKKLLSDIADILYEQRTRKRKSKSATAGGAGINNYQYTRIERGEVNFTIETLERIAKSLGVHISELIPTKSNKELK